MLDASEAGWKGKTSDQFVFDNNFEKRETVVFILNSKTYYNLSGLDSSIRMLKTGLFFISFFHFCKWEKQPRYEDI